MCTGPHLSNCVLCSHWPGLIHALSIYHHENVSSLSLGSVLILFTIMSSDGCRVGAQEIAIKRMNKLRGKYHKSCDMMWMCRMERLGWERIKGMYKKIMGLTQENQSEDWE